MCWGSQPDGRRLSGEAIALVTRGTTTSNASDALATVSRRVGQRIDDFHLLDDRARPAMRDDDRQGMFVRRLDVDEMDIDAVDRLSRTCGNAFSRSSRLSPVVVRPPSSARVPGSPPAARPASRRGRVPRSGQRVARDARTQSLELRLRGDRDLERPDRRGLGGNRHVKLSSPWLMTSLRGLRLRKDKTLRPLNYRTGAAPIALSCGYTAKSHVFGQLSVTHVNCYSDKSPIPIT